MNQQTIAIIFAVLGGIMFAWGAISNPVQRNIRFIVGSVFLIVSVVLYFIVG